MIRIRAKRHNFYRCGIPHPKDWIEYPDDRFTEDELGILEAEPMLTVKKVEDEGGDGGDKDPEDMTIAELKEELGEDAPQGLRKAEYVDLVFAHREAKAAES